MNLLSSFNALLNWEKIHEVIDWEDRQNWTSKNPHPLPVSWLDTMVKRMTTNLDQYQLNNEQLGARKRIVEKIKTKHALEDLPNPVRKFLSAQLPGTVSEFLSACIEKVIDIPATPHHLGNMNKSHMKTEPCKGGIIVSPCNLGPEWLRYFMSALYDYNQTEKMTGQKYFPFKKNSDHFIHSILVAAAGQVILSAPIDADAKRAVERELTEFSVQPGAFDSAKTVQDLTYSVYQKKYIKFLKDNTVENWVKQAWPAIAFWHDSGYDAATWFFLTFREFSHCETLKDIVKDKDRKFIWEHLDKLNTLIGAKVLDPIKDILNNKPVDKDANGYHDIWFIDGWDDEKRPWGRFHALFSAHEFLTRFKADPLAPYFTHLLIAIAEHHEQTDGTRSDDSKVDDQNLAKRFVRNPMGEILSFADAISGLARTEVKQMEPPERLYDKISFAIKFERGPLKIWQPGTKEKKRTQFFRGFKWEDSKMELKKRALWGDFSELKHNALEKSLRFKIYQRYKVVANLALHYIFCLKNITQAFKDKED